MSTFNDMAPRVKVDGRRVTVTFEMPFVVGDACRPPHHWDEAATVSLLPEVGIRLYDNMQKIDCHANGSWYTSTHSQLHGLEQFLPDMAAVLDYWLAEKLEFFEPRISALQRTFAGDQQALERIAARHIELLEAEIVAAKSEMADTVVGVARRVTALETALLSARGAA